jgi:hypothetical protein
MHSLEFQQLCLATSEKLGLTHPSALGLGFSVGLDDVLFDTVFVDGQSSFLLMADLGFIAPEDKASVYERLLAMQMIACDEPRLRFGIHPIRQTAVLCVQAKLDQEANAEKLAALMKSLTLQIAQWRTTHLATHPGGLGHQA